MNKTQKISLVALAIFAATMFAGIAAVSTGSHDAYARHFFGGGFGHHFGFGHGFGFGGGGWGWGNGWGWGGGCCCNNWW